jgi:hypothetical protein
MVLSEIHDAAIVGHSGFAKTYDWLKRYFFRDGMKQEFHTFLAKCDFFQCKKRETVKSPGTL